MGGEDQGLTFLRGPPPCHNNPGMGARYVLIRDACPSHACHGCSMEGDGRTVMVGRGGQLWECTHGSMLERSKHWRRCSPLQWGHCDLMSSVVAPWWYGERCLLGPRGVACP